MRQQSGHASSNGWACLNQTDQSRSDRDRSDQSASVHEDRGQMFPSLPPKRIQVESGSQEREFWGQRLAGQIGPTFPAETERPKPTARMPAKCGHISQVSTNPQMARMRGGCDRDRTCDPYHVKVGRLRERAKQDCFPQGRLLTFRLSPGVIMPSAKGSIGLAYLSRDRDLLGDKGSVMHDEKGSASALEQSEAATMFQGGERLLAQDLSWSVPPQTNAGETSTFPRAMYPNLDMRGPDERPLGNITSTDHTIDWSPTNTLDIRPADECSTRNNFKGSPLDDRRGREARIVLGSVMAALVIGFGGGLASYPYLIPEAPRSGLQQANSSVPTGGKSESTVPKTAMLSRSPTPGAGSRSLNPPKEPPPTVKPPDRTVITSQKAAQPDAAPGNAVKPATQASNLPRPGIIEREAVIQPVPETRPITIEGWVVRDVRGDAIVLQGPNGIRSVMRGDTVPGVGRINSVVRWGNRWVVSTSSGLIATP